MNELTSAQWVKSSYSGSTGDCVEVAALPDSGLAVRDSKRPHGLALRISATEWAAFRDSLKSGELSA
ncbi:DUF397 domain-containing protein [Sphaerisporangium sp. NPDC051011]|uniref:DUF397 domain-containing protein n=1 Tax=Sphaerisporangium sp. NPDC051011 TaxID=3155792 RepID=UPI0033CEF986